MCPPFHGYKIAKPLMSKFMGYNNGNLLHEPNEKFKHQVECDYVIVKPESISNKQNDV